MSLSWLRPAFAIPKLLQMQDLTLNGADDLFWMRVGYSDGSPSQTAKEDVSALLACIHPALMVLTLAGYEVDHVILAIHNIAPAKLLDIDLAAFRYTTPSGDVEDGHTYWYRRTGMEWQTDPNVTPSANIPFLSRDTLVALSFIVRERDRLQTGQVTYGADLGEIVTTFVPGSNDPVQQAITLSDSIPVPEDFSQHQDLFLYTMESLVSTLKPLVQELIEWVQIAISERWLAVDGNPSGILTTGAGFGG